MDQILNVEVIDRLAELGAAEAGLDVASQVVTKLIPEDPEYYLLIDKDATHTKCRKSQPRRANVLLSCADVVLYAQRMQGLVSDDGTGIPQVPIVWISPESILVQDDSDRLRGHFASYRWATSESFNVISNLHKGPSSDGYYRQRDFLKLLRVTLTRYFSDDSVRQYLIDTIRALRTERTTQVGQGSGSYEAGVTTAKNEEIRWPDSFILMTTVYEDPSLTLTWPVEVILDVRPEGNDVVFGLSPVTADLTAAKQKVLALANSTIQDQLNKGTGTGDGKTAPATIPVYLGRPSRKDQD